MLGDLPPVIGVVKDDLLGLYKLVDNLGGYMNVTFNNKWNKVAHLLGLTQEDQEAIEDCYKEYIGLVNIYYEKAQRSKQVSQRKRWLGIAGLVNKVHQVLQG